MEFGCIALLRVEFIGKGVLFDGKKMVAGLGI